MTSHPSMLPAVHCGLVLWSLLGAGSALSAADPASQGTLVVTADDGYVDVVLSVPAAVIPPGLHGAPPRKGAPAETPPYFFSLGGGDGFFRFPAEARCHSDGDWVMRIDASPSLIPDLGSQTGNDGPLPPVPPPGRWLVGAYQFHCIGLMPATAIPWIRLDVFDLLPDLKSVNASMPGRAPGETQELGPDRREFRLPAAATSDRRAGTARD